MSQQQQNKMKFPFIFCWHEFKCLDYLRAVAIIPKCKRERERKEEK